MDRNEAFAYLDYLADGVITGDDKRYLDTALASYLRYEARRTGSAIDDADAFALVADWRQSRR